MIAAGGTGGHVYPALAVAESLIKLNPGIDLHFVGTKGGFEQPLVRRAQLSFATHNEVQAGPIHGVNPVRMIVSLVKLMIGTGQAFGLLRRHKPQSVFSTGGWVSLPVALAARVLGIPMLIYLPDIEPGLTIKMLRIFAKKVAITVPESAQYFREGQTVVTGYPLREAVTHVNRETALQYFGLAPECKTILIFGGSRGARAINMIAGHILGDLIEDGFQVVHITGELDWERTQDQIGVLKDHERYHGFAYLHDEMGLAFAAADLAVCRAGASVLGEFPIFHLPSILIPLAYSWRYQQVNADYLAERGAAIHLDEAQAETELLPMIRGLLHDEKQLHAMRDCAAALARPDGADNVARTLTGLTRQANE